MQTTQLIEKEKKKTQNVQSLVNNTNNQNSLLKQHYGNNNQSDLQKFYGKNSNTNVSLLSNTVPTNVNTHSVNNAAPTATAPSKTNALDTWYNNAIKLNEQNRTAELEENYVRQQLMEKYLPQDMKVNGLSGSGLAELYKQKTNTDYMNNRATINANYNNSNQSLLENYANRKQQIEDEENAERKAEEEQNILDWYERMSGNISVKAAELQNEDGKLSEDDYNSLYKYIEDNKGNINSHYEGLLKNYLDTYKMNEEQLSKYNSAKKLESDIEYISKTYTGIDTSNPIKVEDAGVTSFGTKYNDAGTGKGSQDVWVAKIINMAKNNQLKNGDLVDFDYGKSQDKGNSVYMYYNGSFYKTNKTRDDANIYVDKKGVEHNTRNTGYISAGGGGSFGGR